MPVDAFSSVDRLLGAPPLERVVAAATSRSLRILAYHGVTDPGSFRAQLEHISSHYRPVDAAMVLGSLAGGPPLPHRSVWVTFDDGRADVVDAGMAELDRVGIRATMFICPGLVRDRRPFWWDEVVAGLAPGPWEYDGRSWTDRRLVTHLKTRPDDERREVVATLRERAAAGGTPADPTRVLTADHIERWRASHHDIGNHTWDHPCLDHCSPDAQEAQLVEAHEALTEMLGDAPRLFAYPNGDRSDHAESVLAALGYQAALLFDHRTSPRNQDPLRLSRLRIDADSPLPRAAAILSGAHSALFHARARVSGGPRG